MIGVEQLYALEKQVENAKMVMYVLNGRIRTLRGLDRRVAERRLISMKRDIDKAERWIEVSK